MIRNLILPLLMTFFYASISQGAIIVSGDFSPEEQQVIEDHLRTYTGPRPAYFEEGSNLPENPNAKKILLAKDLPFAEIAFIKNLLAQVNIKGSVAYVPATVWNLHVSNKFLTDKNYKRFRAIESSKDKRALTLQRYFDLSNELFTTVSQHPASIEHFKALVDAYLLNIKNNKFESNAWTDALERELEKIKRNETSILHTMIEEEFAASLINKVLLIRATGGIPFKSKASDEQILDFPYADGDSAWDSIDNFSASLSTIGAFLNTKNLSFADSLLSGFLFDSFNRGKSACSFVFYARDPKLTVYTLHLDKDWLFAKGNKLFYFPPRFLETDGIFGSGETFHPRLREVTPSSECKVEDFKTMCTYSMIATDRLTIDTDSLYQPLVDLDNEKLKIAQFVLHANDALSQARIVSLDGEILKPESYPQKAKDMLRNQTEASLILYKKLQNPA
jgi:hypothetical protein